MSWRDRLFPAFRALYVRLFGSRAARLIWRVPGSRALYRWLMPRLRPDTVTVDGHRLHLDAMDSLLLSVHGNYESFEQALFVSCIRGGDTVADVGAHIGLYTLQAARAAGPAGHVVAFEPAPANRRVLERNIAANGYANVTVVDAAVSDSAGFDSLSLSTDNSGDHSIARSHPGAEQSVTVPTVTLDDYFAERAPEVIKMDIQGAEPAALAGARRTIARAARLVLFTELSPSHLGSPASVASFLDELTGLGFDLFEIDETQACLRPRDPEELVAVAGRGAEHLDLVCLKGPDAFPELLPYVKARAPRGSRGAPGVA